MTSLRKIKLCFKQQFTLAPYWAPYCYIAAIGNGWYLQTGSGATYDPAAHQVLQLQVYQPLSGLQSTPTGPNGIDIVNGDAGNDFIDTALNFNEWGLVA